MFTKVASKREFNKIIEPIIQNNEVQKMKNYIQHFDISCFDHCKIVAYYTYYICKKLNLDYISATRAAMLHDFFLYDWRVKTDSRKGFHAFRHPRIAMERSLKFFDLNEKEKDIILKHMWPVTFLPPKYLEGFILTCTDKYSATLEGLRYYRKKPTFKLLYNNLVIFLAVLFFKL